MNQHALKILEYDKVKICLKQYAMSEQAKSIVDKLQPSIDRKVIEAWLLETTEARKIIDLNPSIPLTALENLDNVMEKTGKGIVLMPGDLDCIKSLLECTRRIRKFMTSMQTAAPVVSTYAMSMFELGELYEEIDRCIRDGRVDDRATPELHSIRKKISIADERMKQKLNSILNTASAAGYLQEPVISTRNGRYVLPVKKEYRKNFDGSVLDTSSSGSTLFMEPAGIAKLQEEINILKIEEENEEYRILLSITGMIDGSARELSINIETLVQYDFIFAKAKYSRALDSRGVKLNTCSRIEIKCGKHPLIGKSAIPLDFHIGGGYRALVITGPNTGGKTVALKSVGLMTMMVQSGLHVPVEEGSEFAVFTDVLADIGDGQSIEQSLSTFSSHVRNISTIIECADSGTLVIMDELGAGTDPGEGMGFAIAVLEEVFGKGSTIVATTHFSEIKEFAGNTEGFLNGCMEFDINTLKPLYKLKIGQPGESNAFLIALRLGIERKIVERAHEITYKEKKEYSYEKLSSQEKLVDRETVETHKALSEEARRVEKVARQTEVQKKNETAGFNMGDCVYISTMKRTGIVCGLENSKGEVLVMVMKKKFKVNKKRLSLHIDGKELYPDDYDYDIVFESKDDRRKKKMMNKRHVEGVFIEKKGEL